MKTVRIMVFDPNEFMPQYRKLSVSKVVNQFTKTLNQAVQSSENSVSGLFGTIELSDGREAKVELRIDAEYINQIV